MTNGVDPRVARSRTSVLSAACALLKDEGYRGFSVEGVSARSGVAKTTIYRHWPRREQLLLDAFRSVTHDPEHVRPFAPTSDLAADLVSELRGLGAALTRGDWIDVLPALIEAAEREPDFVDLARIVVDERRMPVRRRLELAVRVGELPADSDIELLLSQLGGPLFYRRLIAHQPVDDDAMIDRLVQQVLVGARLIQMSSR